MLGTGKARKFSASAAAPGQKARASSLSARAVDIDRIGVGLQARSGHHLTFRMFETEALKMGVTDRAGRRPAPMCRSVTAPLGANCHVAAQPRSTLLHAGGYRLGLIDVVVPVRAPGGSSSRSHGATAGVSARGCLPIAERPNHDPKECRL